MYQEKSAAGYATGANQIEKTPEITAEMHSALQQMDRALLMAHGLLQRLRPSPPTAVSGSTEDNPVPNYVLNLANVLSGRAGQLVSVLEETVRLI